MRFVSGYNPTADGSAGRGEQGDQRPVRHAHRQQRDRGLHLSQPAHNHVPGKKL